MKNSRAAAYLLLTTALVCVGAGPALAGTLEDAHDAASAPFDNGNPNPPSQISNNATVVMPGAGNGSPLAPSTPAAAAKSSSGIPVPEFVSETAGALKDNWKALVTGALVGGFLGVGLGSVIPGAGTIMGGIIGATLGAGVGVLFSGKDSGVVVGQALTGAGLGAVIGMGFGMAFPVIGPILGAVVGGLIGGALTPRIV
jgi:hypothetical protein